MTSRRLLGIVLVLKATIISWSWTTLVRYGMFHTFASFVIRKTMYSTYRTYVPVVPGPYGITKLDKEKNEVIFSKRNRRKGLTYIVSSGTLNSTIPYQKKRPALLHYRVADLSKIFGLCLVCSYTGLWSYLRYKTIFLPNTEYIGLRPNASIVSSFHQVTIRHPCLMCFIGSDWHFYAAVREFACDII